LADLGKEFFRTHDEFSPVVVYQQGNRRTLTFGNQVEQSALNLDDPARLEYVYTQAMILALLFRPDVRNALVLGLGGGALVRALREQAPKARIQGVEQRSGVVTVARDCFFLEDDPMLRLSVADAADYVRDCDSPTDLVFADLYGAEGMDDRQARVQFLRHCRELLRPGGVFVANLWDSEYHRNASATQRLKAAFEGRVLFNHVQGGNIIAYGFAGDVPKLQPKRFFEQAQALGYAMRIPLQKLARSLWRQNAEILKLGRYGLGVRP